MKLKLTMVAIIEYFLPEAFDINFIRIVGLLSGNRKVCQ